MTRVSYALTCSKHRASLKVGVAECAKCREDSDYFGFCYEAEQFDFENS